MTENKIPDAPPCLLSAATVCSDSRRPSSELENVFVNMRKSITNLRKSPWVLSRSKDIQHHLMVIENLLGSSDSLKMVARLESTSSVVSSPTRYFAIVSSEITGSSEDEGFEDHEENVILGIDIIDSDDGDDSNGLGAQANIGLIIPIVGSLVINLRGERSAINCLIHCVRAEKHNSLRSLDQRFAWVSFYELTANQESVNEWNRLPNVESEKTDRNYIHLSPEKREIIRQIRTRLRDIMMKADLDDLTVLSVREKLEAQMDVDLREFKQVINEEMLVVMRQMDSPSQIFDYLYLGSEWNASNLEELQNNRFALSFVFPQALRFQKTRVRGILNVTQEIDNFFPGLFDYHNIRVHDEESTDLLKHWQDSYKFISDLRKKNGKILVHCKMGVSRSASTVIAFAMKENGWSVYKALDYVKKCRSCVQPNPGFMNQLFVYEGILKASKLKQWRRKPMRCRSCSADNLDKIDEDGDCRGEPVENSPSDTNTYFKRPSHGNSRDTLRSSNASTLEHQSRPMPAGRPCFVPMHRKASLQVDDDVSSFPPAQTSRKSIQVSSIPAMVFQRSATWPRVRCDIVSSSLVNNAADLNDSSSPITPMTPSSEWLAFFGSHSEDGAEENDSREIRALNKRVSFQRSKTLVV